MIAVKEEGLVRKSREAWQVEGGEEQRSQVWRNNKWASWRSLFLRLRDDTKTPQGNFRVRCGIQLSSTNIELFKDRLLMNDIFVPHLSLSYPKDTRQPSPLRLTCTTCCRFMRLRAATICQPTKGLKSQPETLRTSHDTWITRNIWCSAPAVLRMIYVHYVSSGILEPDSWSLLLPVSFQLCSRGDARTQTVLKRRCLSWPWGCFRPLCQTRSSASHLTHIEVVNLICRVSHQPDSKQFN